MREQYSQTETLGKAEGDVARKKIIGSKLKWQAEDEYHSKLILKWPRRLPHRVPKEEGREPIADFRAGRNSSNSIAGR